MSWPVSADEELDRAFEAGKRAGMLETRPDPTQQQGSVMSTLDYLREIRDAWRSAPAEWNRPHADWLSLLDYAIRLAEAAEPATRYTRHNQTVQGLGVHTELLAALGAPIEGMKP